VNLNLSELLLLGKTSALTMNVAGIFKVTRERLQYLPLMRLQYQQTNMA
jgi:hypothetical protein